MRLRVSILKRAGMFESYHCYAGYLHCEDVEILMGAESRIVHECLVAVGHGAESKDESLCKHPGRS